jgi:hypothetical protein
MRDLAVSVRKAGGTMQRAGRGRIRITGPSGSVTIQEISGETRRDLVRDSAGKVIAERTGLELR